MDNQTPDLGRKAISGTFWTYTAYYSGKLMVFLSTIILAYLLTKDDYGVAGYALVTMSFLEILRDLGVGSALIYHRDSPDARETAFWLSIFIGATLFILSWFVAPLAGLWFDDPRAVPVTRILALNFPLSALGNVHNVLMSKELMFKRKFLPEFIRATSKGLASIILAALGFGAWSLIIGHLAGTVISTFVFWWIMPWRPSFRFSRQLVKPFLTYGTNLVAVKGMGVLQANTDYLLIGRVLGAASLGVYTLAFRIPDLLIVQFCTTISRVIFPIYAKMRDDTAGLLNGFIVATRYISLITVPIGLGLALIAEPFVLVILQEKWTEAIPVIQAIAIYAMIFSLYYSAGDVYKAQGEPSILVKIAIFISIVQIPALAWAVMVPGSIIAVGWVQAGIALLNGIIQFTVAARILKTPILKILEALRPAAICGSIMALTVWAVLQLLGNTGPLPQLIFGVLAGLCSYACSFYILQRPIFQETLQILNTVLKSRRQRKQS